VSIVDDVRDAVPPSLAAEIVVLTAGAALVVFAYWADRRYRRWAEEASPFAPARARAAAVKTGYRRKRSVVTETTQVIGEILGAFEELRSRTRLDG
jgi:hypothetical protein